MADINSLYVVGKKHDDEFENQQVMAIADMAQ